MIICAETGKIGYSYRQARELIGLARKGKNRERKTAKKIPKREYYCDCCRHYHLSHMKNYTLITIEMILGNESVKKH